MRYLAIIFFISISHTILSQETSIIHINPKNFPIIEAVISSDDPFEKKQVLFKEEDFNIMEENRTKEIIKIINPEYKELPLSILLVFDISGSMTNSRMGIVRNAADNFISRIPLEVSEIAISSFNDNSILNCDFTHNRNSLLAALDNLNAYGGTSYSEAYLNNSLGAIELSKSGKNKKVIIFLTDGQSNIDSEKVISLAHEYGITIYNITVTLPMPQELKDISLQTGGTYYESAQSETELGGIFRSLLSTIQSGIYGKVFWKAPHGCNSNRSGTIEYKNKSYSYSYSIPESKVSRLNISHKELLFGNVKPGNSKSLEVKLIPKNAPIIINQSIINNGAYNLLTPLSFDTLLPNQENTFTLQYSPQEEGIQTGTLKFLIENCPIKSVSLTGGKSESVQFALPKGGEKYSVGTDTVIAWKGIKKEREVDIFYRPSDSVAWQNIGTGQNHTHLWEIPNKTGNKIQLKIQPKSIRKDKLNYEKEIRLIGTNSIFQTFSQDDSLILLANYNGEVTVLDINSKYIKLTARGMGNQGVCYNRNNKIVSFGRTQTSLHDGTSGQILSTLSNNKKIRSSLIMPDGNEYLLPSINRKLKNGQTIIRSPFYEVQDTIKDSSPITHSVITSSGERAITLNLEKELKIWDLTHDSVLFAYSSQDIDRSYIVNPNERTTLVRNSNSEIEMLDMANGKQLFSLEGYTYQQFSRSGEYFICRSSNDSTCFIDSYSGELLKCISKKSSFLTFKQGYKILIYRNDSLVLQNLDFKSEKKQLYSPGLVKYLISPDDRKILLLNSSGNHTLIRSKTFEIISEFLTAPSMNFNACFANTNGKVLIQIEKDAYELWTPEVKEFESAISNVFSIVKPSIQATDSIDLGACTLNKATEFQLTELYKNKSDVTAEIKAIKLIGKDFSLVNPINNYKLKQGESVGPEIRFTPSEEKNSYSQLFCYTQYDTLSTIIYGRGVASHYKILSNPKNIGKINIQESLDTTLSLLVNTSNTPIHITNIKNSGPDTNQILVLDNKQQDIVLPGDTLKLSFKFIGTRGGRTATQINFQPDEFKSFVNLTIYGEVLAPSKYFIAGSTLNSADSLPLNAEVTCIDLESDYKISTTISGNNGQFILTVNPGRSYGIFSSKSGYISSSQNINLTQAFPKDTIFRNVFLTQIQHGATIRLNCILYDFNSSKLNNISYIELNKVLELLNKESSMSIEIHGHTDNIGSDSFNMKLSKNRALSIKNYLVEQGINPNRLFIKAWGSKKPIANNKDEIGRSQNRRVEIKIP